MAELGSVQEAQLNPLTQRVEGVANGVTVRNRQNEAEAATERGEGRTEGPRFCSHSEAPGEG